MDLHSQIVFSGLGFKHYVPDKEIGFRTTFPWTMSYRTGWAGEFLHRCRRSNVLVRFLFKFSKQKFYHLKFQSLLKKSDCKDLKIPRKI